MSHSDIKNVFYCPRPGRSDAWSAQVRVGKKQFRKMFSISKYGSDHARELAHRAVAELKLAAGVAEPRHRKCEQCNEVFEAALTGAQRFCSNACRQRAFYHGFKERAGFCYKAQWRVPSRPQYERPEIPYERETEIALLTDRRWVVCLDAPLDDDGDLHSNISGSALTPLEILMMKEDEESPETQWRRRETDRFTRWAERQASAFAEVHP